jgi:hypothetical protein
MIALSMILYYNVPPEASQQSEADGMALFEKRAQYLRSLAHGQITTDPPLKRGLPQFQWFLEMTGE